VVLIQHFAMQLLESSIHNAFPVVRVRNELDNPPHSFGTLIDATSAQRAGFGPGLSQ
jgi:hypothetical protein